MKTFKKILLSILALFVISSIAAYFYFDQKFSPAENYLEVRGEAENVKFVWDASDGNPYSALLFPIKITGINRTFYMQFDSGSPVTIFYKNGLESIVSNRPNPIKINADKNEVSLEFAIGNLLVKSNKFQLIDYGQKVDFENPESINIIGTIGTDLLEKRITTLDFKNAICSFTENVDNSNFEDLEFKKRKILIPAKIAGENLKLLYDSGTSGYQLILNKQKFDAYKIPNSKLKIEKGNSWGKTLKVISTRADQKIEFAKKVLPLTEITNIEGTSALQNFLMKSSGMQGMIGNKLFLQHKLTLDCKRQKFRLE